MKENAKGLRIGSEYPWIQQLRKPFINSKEKMLLTLFLQRILHVMDVPPRFWGTALPGPFVTAHAPSSLPA